MKGKAGIFQIVCSINKLKFSADAEALSINKVEAYIVDSPFMFYIQGTIYFLCCGLDNGVVRQEIRRQPWSCCNPSNPGGRSNLSILTAVWTGTDWGNVIICGVK
jgi:hypothetical protein